MLTILDYKAGNQTSVLRALQSLGIEAVITDDTGLLLKSKGVIFPGVGAAGQAMEHLKSTGQDAVLKQLVENNIPLLGICLGCQILLQKSDENDTQTLGIIPGYCRRFPSEWKEEQDWLHAENGQGGDDSQSVKNEQMEHSEYIRIPHMGWNALKIYKKSPLLENINDGDTVYYVHSYYPEPEESRVGDVFIPGKWTLATSTYGKEFPSIFGRDGLWAVQFHPEKSAKVGLQLLKNFYNYCNR